MTMLSLRLRLSSRSASYRLREHDVEDLPRRGGSPGIFEDEVVVSQQTLAPVGPAGIGGSEAGSEDNVAEPFIRLVNSRGSKFRTFMP